MGFQTGSKIDPRLGALDYSGYAKAGAIQGEAIAGLGKDIGDGIEKYYKEKEDAAEKEAFAKAVEPYLLEMTGGDADEAKALGNALRKNPRTFAAVQGLIADRAAKEKAAMTQQTLSMYASGDISAKVAFDSGYVTPDDLVNMDKAMPNYSAVEIAKNLEAFQETTGLTYDPEINSFRGSSGMLDYGNNNNIIPNSDPRVQSFFRTPQGQSFLNSGMRVEQTTNGDASRSEGSGQSANVVTPPVTSAVLNNVVPVNTEGSRAGRFVGGIDDSVSSVINKGVSTTQQVGVNALASVPAGLQYLFSEDDPSFDSNFRISQSILSNLQPDFDLQRFPSREQVRAEALKRFQ
jgi:hypothetical protein